MLRAALRYFLLIFALGFLLGTARIMMTAPVLGPVWSLVLELPVMLLASVVIARQSLAMYEIDGPLRGLGMGLLAFAMLMAAEAALAWLLYGNDPLHWARNLLYWPGVLGFGGQVCFGLLPLLLSFTRRTRLRL